MPSSASFARAEPMTATVSGHCDVRQGGSERVGTDTSVSYADRMVATTTAARAATSELVDGIPPRARLHVITGKGGTGKTTVAAALALALASGGRKVL